MIKTALKQVVGIASVSLLVACGGGGSSDNGGNKPPTEPPKEPTVTMVKGQAFKGPVYQATVIAFDENGNELGRTQTNQNGQYELAITPAYLGVVRIEVVGGHYVDEATGNEVALDGKLNAMKTLTGSDETVHVTPLTELASRRVSDNNESPSIANQVVANAFSLKADLVSTQPENLLDENSSAKGEGTEYALVIAGMSQMVANSDGQKSLESVLTEMDEDLGDGEGLNNNALLGELNQGINDFIDSSNNKARVSKDDTDLDTQFKPLVAQPDALVFANAGPVTVSFSESPVENPVTGGTGNGTLIYTSSNPAIAEVNGETGSVSLTGVGNVRISATKAADDTYLGQTVSYTLNVTKAQQAPLAFTQAGPLQAVYGESLAANPITGGTGSGEVTYGSDDSSIAQVNATTGAITLVGVGTTTITAIKASDAHYQAATATYTLTVSKAGQSPLQFVNGSLTGRLGEAIAVNAIQGGSGAGAVGYRSSDTNIATVHPITGAVTSKAVGQVIISADKAGDNFYLPTTASYTLTISKGLQTGLAFNAAQVNKTFGDGVFVNPIMGALGTGNLTFSSSQSEIASVSDSGQVTLHGAGEVTITASKAGDSQYETGTASYRLVIAKQPQTNFQFVASSLTKTYGDAVFSHALQGETGTGAISYRSNDSGVASIDADGNITLHAAGSVVIEATKAADANYAEATAIFTLTVEKATQAALVFSQPNVTKSFGDADFSNALSETGEGQGSISYSSDDASVATVDADGTITITGAGSTQIHATKAADAQYSESSGSFVLNVGKAQQSDFAFQNAQVTKTFGEAAFVPVTEGGSGSGAVSFSSSNPGVASVSNDGTITLVGAGTATIHATKAEDANYQAAQASFTLIVGKAEQTGFAFIQPTLSVTFGDDNFTHGLTGGNGDGALTYSSSDSSVASIDSSTGLVAVLNAGTTTITVTKAGSDNYLPATASYTLTVDRATQSGLLFGSATVNKEYGQPAFTNSVSGGQGSGALSYASSDTNVASVDASGEVSIHYTGTVEITVTKAGDVNYQAQSASFTLVVGRTDQAALTFTNQTLQKRVGDTDFINTLAESGSGNGGFSYEVSNPSVATVNANDGTLQIHAAGTTTVTVTKAADDLYKAATGSFILNVGQGDQQGFSFAQVTVNKTFGDSAFSQLPTGGNGTGDVSFVSSNPSLATVTTSGEVHIFGAGTVTISAIKAADANYLATQASYQLVIGKAAPQGLRFSNTTASVDYGEALPNNPVINGSSSGAISFSSGDTNIALVDAGNGSVTIVRPGAVQILVTQAGDDNYLPATASYTLTINKGAQQPLSFEHAQITRTFAEGGWPQTDFSNSVSGGSGTGRITYDISDTSVLKIQSPTVYRVLSTGTVTVTATKAADDFYRETTAQFTLTVDKGEQELLYFSAGVVNKLTSDIGTTYTNDLRGGSGTGTVTYSSNNPEVATVDDNGVLTIVGFGTAQITAIKAGDANYLPQTATSEIAVAKIQQASFAFSTGYISKVFGDADFAQVATGGSGAGAISYTSSDVERATVDSDGNVSLLKPGIVTIQATKAGDDIYLPAQTTYSIEIDFGQQAPLAFSEDLVIKRYGSGTFTVPLSAEGSGTGGLRYSSSNEVVALIDYTTGAINMRRTGTVTITVIKSGDSHYQQTSASMTLQIDKGIQGPISWAQSSVSKPYVLGERDDNELITSGQGTGLFFGSSSDTSVISVGNSGGVPLIYTRKVGTAVISVYRRGDDLWEEGDPVSYTLTITKGNLAPLVFTENQVTALVGDDSFINPIVDKPSGVQFTSSDTGIAHVNSVGRVTPLAEGTVTITASKDGGDTHFDISASYTLTVDRREQDALTFEEASVTKAYSTETFTNAVEGGNGSGALSYSSADTDIATVDTNGVVQMVGVGTTTITVTKAGDTTYKPVSNSFDLTVNKGQQERLVFNQAASVQKQLTDSAFTNTVTGGSGIGAISYVSANPVIASVNANTGEVTLHDEGAVDITATKAGDSLYEAVSTSYRLNIADNHVVAFYSNAPDWNDYVRNDGSDRLSASDTTCVPITEDSGDLGTFNSCIHGGEIRAISVPTKSSCDGLAATDLLGAFDWRCDASTNPVQMVSIGLKPDVMMSALMDFDNIQWELNQVTVTDNGAELLTTLPAAWWQNPVTKAVVSEGITQASTVYLAVDEFDAALDVDGIDKFALVFKPGVVAKHSADIQPASGDHMISVTNAHHVWLEVDIDRRPGLKLSSFYYIGGLNFNTVSYSVVRGARITEGGIRLNGRNVFNSRFEHIVASGEYSPTQLDSNYLINFYLSSGNKLENIQASNGDYGIALNNSNRTFIHKAMISNTNFGLVLKFTDDSLVQDVTIVNTRNIGLKYEIGTYHTVVNNVTVVNAGMQANVIGKEKAAVYMEGKNAVFTNVAIVGTGASGIGFEADGQISGNSKYQNLAIDQFETAMIAGNHQNYYTGKLILGDISGAAACANNEDTGYNNGGLYALNANCTAGAGPSDFVRVLAPAWRQNAFVGWITGDDIVNMTDINGASPVTNLVDAGIDWSGFENPYRHWAIDAGLFEDASAYPWKGEAGRIVDWSLRAADTRIRAILPKILSGNVANTITHTNHIRPYGNNPKTDRVSVQYLRNAVEILSDNIGNDNGLCESNETCLYTPNIGSYQGHGALISAGNFVDGDTITGVTLLQYEHNGY